MCMFSNCSLILLNMPYAQIIIGIILYQLSFTIHFKTSWNMGIMGNMGILLFESCESQYHSFPYIHVSLGLGHAHLFIRVSNNIYLCTVSIEEKMFCYRDIILLNLAPQFFAQIHSCLLGFKMVLCQDLLCYVNKTFFMVWLASVWR